MDEYLAELVPVSEWAFYLYKVTYWKVERDAAQPHKVIYLVSTDTHIGEECQRYWPSDWYTVYTDDEIATVSRPRQVGTVHGMRLDEDARTAGEREAKARGLV